MCGKGSQTTTQQTNQTQTPNPQAMAAYQNILGQAQNVAATPYQPYGGQLVAPVNPQQYSGIANINAYQPAFGTAEGMAYNAAQPITAADIQQYESPYTQQVVNATEAQFANQNAQQQQQVLGNAVAQGALGGNRVGVAQANLANQQALAQDPVIANLENQGYMTGLNTALTEQQAMQQGAYGVANMAQAGLQGANAQIGAGTLEQQTQQAQDQALYGQYLAAMGYPFQTTQWLAGIGTGVGSQMGGTTSGYGTTTGPPPNSMAQWLGLGAAGLGAFGQFAGSAAGSAALAGLFARGGGVNGYADGGGVAGVQTIPEDHETLKAQQRQLVAGDRHVQMFPHGTPELPLPPGMRRVESHSGTFHYNPQHVSHSDIHRHSANGHEHVLLGLGPYSKHDVMRRISSGEHPLAIVERNEHGHEVRSAIGTPSTVRAQHDHMSRSKSRNHTIHVEHPLKVLGERMRGAGNRQSGGGVSNYPIFGGGYGQPMMPYSGGPLASYVPGMGSGIHGNPFPPAMQMSSPPSSGQSPMSQSQMGAIGKNLGSFFTGMQNLDQGQGTKLAGLDPSSQGDYISQADEAAMEEGQSASADSGYDLAYDGGQRRGGRVGVANYSSGGGVDPMTLDDMVSAFGRISKPTQLAGDVVQGPQQWGTQPRPTPDDRVRALNQMLRGPGVAPPQPAQIGPPRSLGGVAGYQDGGAPDDYQVADLEPGDDRKTMTDVPPPSPSEDEALAYGPARSGVASPVPVGVAAGETIPSPRPHPESPGIRPPPDTSTGVAASASPSNDVLDRAAAATRQQESGGDYGNVTTTYDRHGKPQSALGAYGIMDFNLPQWSQAALGRTVSRDEFLNSPAIQDKIYRYKMGDYINRFGVEGAGRAWLGGEGALNAPQARDPLGTSVGSYGSKFASLVNSGAVRSDANASGLRPGVQLASMQERLPLTSQPAQAPTGVAPAQGNFFSQTKDFWPALMAAGFGIAAEGSRPGSTLAGSIGRGGLEGMGYFTQQQQIRESQRMSQAKIDNEATKLSNEATWHENELRQQAMIHSETMEEKRQEMAVKASEPKPFYNAKTGQMDYTTRTPDGDVVVMSTGEVIAGPHRGAPPALQTGQPGLPGQPGLQSAVFHPDKDGTWKFVSDQVGDDPARPNTFDYSRGENLPVEKGMVLPVPAPVGGKDSRTIAAAAEWYALTGKLPTGMGMKNSAQPMAIMNNNFVNAVMSYGNALAASRGITAQEQAENWQGAPMIGRFILGQPGQQTVSLGTAMRHLETYKEYAQAWHQAQQSGNWDLPALNKARAMIAYQFGQNAGTNLSTVSQILGPEIIKAIGVAGAGGEGEREHARGLFNEVTSMPQAEGSVAAAEHLMKGQLMGKLGQARAIGMSDDRFKKLVGEREFDELQKVDQSPVGGTQQGTAAPAGGGTAGTAPTARVPTDADRAYARAHPEVLDKYRKTFGQEP